MINSRFIWYLTNLRNLCIACMRIAFYCLRHPRKVGQLCFSFFSSINEFYQSSHGKLYPFEQSTFYQKMQDSLVFAQGNVFNKENVVTRPGETQILSSLVRYLKPKKIFEIGTYNGFTTLHFAYNMPDDGKVYSLDLPADFAVSQDKGNQQYSYDDLLVIELSQKNIKNRIFKKDPMGQKVVELFGDSRTFDYTPYYGQMDLVFIDGNHSYDFVKSDTENAFKMLSDKGVIIWHDFDYIIHRDVFKYLNNLVKTHKIYSIMGTRFAIFGKQML